MKHLNEPLPDIREAIPDFPQELDDILERMRISLKMAMEMIEKEQEGEERS